MDSSLDYLPGRSALPLIKDDIVGRKVTQLL